MSSIREDVLRKRYFRKDGNGAPVEDWPGLCGRVARALARDEAEELEFRQAMEGFEFLPNTPALVNAGREKFSMSACFVLPVEDSMEGIFDAVKHAALIHKAGGGTGFSFSRLRPSGSTVGTTQGVASGPCSFIRVFDTATEVTKQGGTRRGANMGVLRVDHPDILEFIGMKKEEGRLSNFNISVALTDAFMLAVRDDAPWDIVWDGQVVKTVSSREIWDAIVEGAWRNGEPGVLFIDKVNAGNPTPHVGEFEATNPCWTGGTKVWTIHGPQPFADLAKTGEDVPVLSQDESGMLKFEMMRAPRLTRKGAEIVRVTLDSGGSLTCTPDHGLHLTDGRKVAAGDLRSGDSLASVYRYKANQKGYLRLTNGVDMPLEHHVAVSWVSWRRPEYPREHCHHIDGDKSNSRPDNLVIMSGGVHGSQRMVGSNNPMCGVWNQRNPLFGRPVGGSMNPRYRQDLDDSLIHGMRKDGMSVKAIAKKLGCSHYTVMKRLGWSRPSEKPGIVNHKVVSVERLAERADVFNGTVDDTHRYFVMTGENDAVLSGNCGEQPLLPYEACVLGSVNLVGMIATDGGVDFPRLRCVVATGVRMLDRIIDVQHYPLPEIERMHKSNRKIGLGVMGWADLLLRLRLKYNSPEAVALAEEVMSAVSDGARAASSALAASKGVFPNWENSVWAGRSMPVRNATVTTIAPTGSISLIAGCSSGVEPVFAFETTQRRMDQEFSEVHPIAKEWRKANPSKPLPEWFAAAADVPVEWHIRMQAAFQKHTDNAVSKTVNLPNGATKEDVDRAFRLAYDLGCKGLTVYRDGSRSAQVIEAKGKTPAAPAGPAGDVLPDVLDAKRVSVDTPEGKVYITVSTLGGKPVEVFIASPVETKAAEIYESFARVISTALRGGVPVGNLLGQLEKANRKYGHVASIPAAVVRAFRKIGMNGKGSLEMCPDCQGVLVLEEGCIKCHTCGFTKC